MKRTLSPTFRSHQVRLAYALAIVLLLARREPHNYSRAAARFLGPLTLERPIDPDDLAAATPALFALPHAGTAEFQVLCRQWGVEWRPPRRLPPSPDWPPPRRSEPGQLLAHAER